MKRVYIINTKNLDKFKRNLKEAIKGKNLTYSYTIQEAKTIFIIYPPLF